MRRCILAVERHRGRAALADARALPRFLHQPGRRGRAVRRRGGRILEDAGHTVVLHAMGTSPTATSWSACTPRSNPGAGGRALVGSYGSIPSDHCAAESAGRSTRDHPGPTAPDAGRVRRVQAAGKPPTQDCSGTLCAPTGRAVVPVRGDPALPARHRADRRQAAAATRTIGGPRARASTGGGRARSCTPRSGRRRASPIARASWRRCMSCCGRAIPRR